MRRRQKKMDEKNLRHEVVNFLQYVANLDHNVVSAAAADCGVGAAESETGNAFRRREEDASIGAAINRLKSRAAVVLWARNEGYLLGDWDSDGQNNNNNAAVALLRTQEKWENDDLFVSYIRIWKDEADKQNLININMSLSISSSDGEKSLAGSIFIAVSGILKRDEERDEERKEVVKTLVDVFDTFFPAGVHDDSPNFPDLNKCFWGYFDGNKSLKYEIEKILEEEHMRATDHVPLLEKALEWVNNDGVTQEAREDIYKKVFSTQGGAVSSTTGGGQS